MTHLHVAHEVSAYSTLGSMYIYLLLNMRCHIITYRTQYHGTGGRPIGSLTTIHNNIPIIPITLVNIAL